MKNLKLIALYAAASILFVSCKDKKDPVPGCGTSGLSVKATVAGDDITAVATGGTSPYKYSLDNANFQTSGQFDNKKLGNYTVYVKDANNCVTTNTASINTFKDSRDNKTYKAVTISNQTWMAQDLFYEGELSQGSALCPSKSQDSCNKYQSKRYTIDAAKIACPNGWHLPSDAEWQLLEHNIGMSDADTAKISEFNRGADQGLGPKLMEGGSSGLDLGTGGLRRYWTSTEVNGMNYIRSVYNYTPSIGRIHYDAKTSYLAVRCIQNN